MDATPDDNNNQENLANDEVVDRSFKEKETNLAVKRLRLQSLESEATRQPVVLLETTPNQSCVVEDV